MAAYQRYKAVTDRLPDGIKRAQKLAKLAIEREMNEAQTTDVVEDILDCMFHYDRFEDRKPQFNIDDKSKNIVDILLEFNGIRVPVEIKHAAMKLTSKQEGQLEDYVKLLGSEFGILTTGVEWRIYQCSADDGMVMIAHFRLDVDSSANVAEQAYPFSKESIKGGHTAKQAELASYLQAGNIADALVSKRVLAAIRLEMKAKHGCNLDEGDIRNVLMGEVVNARLLSPSF